MEVNGEVVMVRYGRQDGKPKNTLYTIRKNDTIYFGISRCNAKHDQFRKEAGKHIASERALLAVDEFAADQVSDFTLYQNGLRGVCPTEKVIEMLQYFDNIDEVLINKHEVCCDL
jgi:hypothetical protein